MNISAVDNQSRLQIDNSTLASLIALNQSIGQLQGEIAVLKATGVNLKDIERTLDNLNKIVVTGDINSESLIRQIRDYKGSVEELLHRVRSTEKLIEGISDKKKVNSEKTISFSIDSIWKVIVVLVGAILTGLATWLDLK